MLFSVMMGVTTGVGVVQYTGNNKEYQRNYGISKSAQHSRAEIIQHRPAAPCINDQKIAGTAMYMLFSVMMGVTTGGGVVISQY